IVKVRENTGKQVGILWDTRGPEFRTGKFENDKIDLVPGENIKIVKDEVIGNKDRFSVNHSEALNNIEVGNTILIDNGKMKLSVIDKDEKSVTCNVIAGGELSNNKSINVPGVSLNLPYVSREDKKDIEYACRNDGEFLAISFVNSKNDVLEIRKILLEYDRPDIKIISKIESSIAIDNIDEILEVSDGVMIARGDLGTEIPSEKLPIVQKQIIKKARKLRKIAIVATEMLESMIDDIRPKRAETSDIANAVLDGTDAVMLSGETTIGHHPIDVCTAMGKICEVTEEYASFDYIDEEKKLNDITTAIAEGVVDAANRLGAKLICASTISGNTAQEISNLKPDTFILALCPNDKICRSLSLNWGVYTKIIPFYNSTDDILTESINMAKEFLNLEKDDIVITTGSFPNTGESNPTNLMKIERID
ncbi:MAG: pyruvate kinase, partial [Bacilli bacterium]|nr:pyruvate kinase [Bacilli bacterium]